MPVSNIHSWCKLRYLAYAARLHCVSLTRLQAFLPSLILLGKHLLNGQIHSLRIHFIYHLQWQYYVVLFRVIYVQVCLPIFYVYQQRNVPAKLRYLINKQQGRPVTINDCTWFLWDKLKVSSVEHTILSMKDHVAAHSRSQCLCDGRYIHLSQEMFFLKASVNHNCQHSPIVH